VRARRADDAAELGSYKVSWIHAPNLQLLSHLVGSSSSTAYSA
jgi:hypothetical protein